MAITLETSTSKAQELVELAVQEGHDADIPSNEGVVTTTPAGTITASHVIRASSPKPDSRESTKSITESLSEKDLEKGLVSAAKTPVSVTHGKVEGTNGIVGDEVGWDGDEDPQNPMNWPASRKWGAVSVVAAITFLTPLGSSIFAPGVPAVMSEFNSNSELLSGFVLSVYVLGFAFGPLSKTTVFRRYLILTNTSNCPSQRNVRPAHCIPRQRRAVCHLYRSLRPKHVSEHAHRLSLLCRSSGSSTFDAGRRHDCRSHDCQTARQSNVRMGHWPK
jgi:hypothetical protein